MEVPSVSDPFELRHAATNRVTPVNVPPRRFLGIDGFGPPLTPGYQLALRTLRAADEWIRARRRGAGFPEPPSPKPECLWRPGAEALSREPWETFASRDRWHWEQLIELPPPGARDEAVQAVEAVRREAGRERPLMRVVELRELEARQILAVGGPEAQADALRRLLQGIAADGLEASGSIHQICLTDPGAVATDRERSILRVPVASAARVVEPD